MKQLLYLVISLVFIAAIIPASSAAYNCSMTPSVDSYSGSQPWTIDSGVTTQAEANAICIACGHASTVAAIGMTGFNSGGGWIWDSRAAGVWQSRNLTDPNVRYVRRWILCSNGVATGTARVSDGACVADTEPDFLYHEPFVPSECTAGTLPNFLIDFTGSPLSGPAPLAVSFTATNTSHITGSSWTFGDGNISLSSINPISHLYQNQGIYTVRLDFVNNSGVADFVQKNNYINVSAPNATKTKYFQTIDGTNGNIVLNSSLQLKDIENSSWTNATGLTADGMSSITTLLGHHVSAYAQALGYSDADDLNILNDGTPRYIMMWPTFAKNVSAGNVSLYVTVKDKDTHANIVGAGVTASLASGSMSTTTNDAGIAYFIVKNSSMVLITAQAIGQGYQTATTTINTGTASGGSASAAATILLGKNTVTPVFSTVVTTLPGGGTPTPVITVLPGCEDTSSPEGQAKCRKAQSNQGLSFLGDNMMNLIMICVVMTMLYLMGIRLGK